MVLGDCAIPSLRLPLALHVHGQVKISYGRIKNHLHILEYLAGESW